MSEEVKGYPIDGLLDEIREAVRVDDRGKLAKLRRGLSDTTQEDCWEYVVKHCRMFANENVRTIWCTIAGIAALLMPEKLDSTQKWYEFNLGDTMRAIACSGGGDPKDALSTFEPMFRRLLSIEDAISLCEYASRIAQAAKAKGVALNIVELFWALNSWSDQDKREKTRIEWAKHYFGGV